jgi:hypothetical protein
MIRVDVEADDPSGMDPDNLCRQVTIWSAVTEDGFGHPPDLEEMGTGHPRLGYLVDDETDLRVRLDVSILRASGHIESSNINGLQGLVVGEAHWLHLRCPIGSDRCEMPPTKSGEKPFFGWRQDHMSKSITSGKVEVKDMRSARRRSGVTVSDRLPSVALVPAVREACRLDLSPSVGAPGVAEVC